MKQNYKRKQLAFWFSCFKCLLIKYSKFKMQSCLLMRFKPCFSPPNKRCGITLLFSVIMKTMSSLGFPNRLNIYQGRLFLRYIIVFCILYHCGDGFKIICRFEKDFWSNRVLRYLFEAHLCYPIFELTASRSKLIVHNPGQASAADWIAFKVAA